MLSFCSRFVEGVTFCFHELTPAICMLHVHVYRAIRKSIPHTYRCVYLGLRFPVMQCNRIDNMRNGWSWGILQRYQQEVLVNLTKTPSPRSFSLNPKPVIADSAVLLEIEEQGVRVGGRVLLSWSTTGDGNLPLAVQVPLSCT